MKNEECAETIAKSIFRFLRLLVFDIWSFLYSKNKKSENKFFIRFISLRIFHENGSKTKGGSAYPYLGEGQDLKDQIVF